MPNKVRSLQVRPWKSADLAFEIGGVLATQNANTAELGKTITGFDLPGFLASLKGTQPSNPGRLKSDAAAIRQPLLQNSFFTLRSTFQENALEQVIAQREIAWLERFKHKKEVLAALNEVYPSGGVLTGKVQRLKSIRDQLQQHRDALKGPYEKQQGWNTDIKENVVKDLLSDTQHGGIPDADTKLTPVAMQTSATTITVTGTAPSTHAVGGPQMVPQKWNGISWADMKDGELGFRSQVTKTVFV